MNDYYVYILTNKKDGTLYVGVSNNLLRRFFEYKGGTIAGFTKMYYLNKLAYFEHVMDINAAIQREKRLKKWNRDWKIKLIESKNPEWKDLSQNI